MQTELAPSARRRSRHPDSWVYFDGEVVRYHDVHLGPMTHALHYGTGCFEGIRAYWNPAQEQLHILQAEAHYDRLRRSATILRLALPHSTSELVRLTVDLLRCNAARTDTYIRPLVFISEEVVGVSLHNLTQSLLIYTAPMG
ncbi:MAG TPA: aminotransferase class IV, partial [Chloroflexota bacterium]|nr:aminotransferase class IV [Chloroflexota bacterium]